MNLVSADTLGPGARDDLRAIYEQSFDERLRSPFDDLLRDSVLVLADPRPHGMAVLRELGPTGWVFLRYFVVAAERRGDGVGARLWKLLTQAMRDAGHTRIVFDVEDPARTDDPAEAGIRRRRIGFYTRLGAQLLPVKGYTPPHGEEEHPLLLMAADLAVETTRIHGGDLRDVVLAVYRHRYGLDPENPVVRKTLRQNTF
ncbi:GNAT family N-acetyltransferase [Actinocrispum sp. NPDC049592]|uniref:GNAT family N-acetyltransferase n=1 Tax=Actinocrispum sp. NPDC049592 TaxID=3154835 RepID=UPI00343E3F81